MLLASSPKHSLFRWVMRDTGVTWGGGKGKQMPIHYFSYLRLVILLLTWGGENKKTTLFSKRLFWWCKDRKNENPALKRIFILLTWLRPKLKSLIPIVHFAPTPFFKVISQITLMDSAASYTPSTSHGGINSEIKTDITDVTKHALVVTITINYILRA
jgi:hypothetical protein